MVRFELDRLMFERNRMKVPELHETSGVNKNTLYAYIIILAPGWIYRL